MPHRTSLPLLSCPPVHLPAQSRRPNWLGSTDGALRTKLGWSAFRMLQEVRCPIPRTSTAATAAGPAVAVVPAVAEVTREDVVPVTAAVMGTARGVDTVTTGAREIATRTDRAARSGLTIHGAMIRVGALPRGMVRMLVVVAGAMTE
ncbi:hypothetical protein JOF55_000496 [Haloactinomyces albus]|uniref:Uncharacterized protein n=1 Tax=Haloactinomyces albus TaxID=1352928 RepID=A0AAE3ZAF2_9ACTN|nr:hypothetical protein [Haloactinomyces albus]